ncbi:MAG: small acid-soluble spore protein SspI [Bacilli bacterium]|nr:small acid-soluble spore protein SspI [Bacilli bacterium]
MDIREYVINNFKGSGFDEISSSVRESVKDKDEVTLPGLGVLFELLWDNSDDNMRHNIISIIEKSLK